METHISAVFIGAETVFKLRKALRLVFVDFTGLAERERTARRELELNAPNAPGLYRDVVAVVRRGDGTLALGGEGAVVDWVVRMARVAAGDFLDEVAGRADARVAGRDGGRRRGAACGQSDGFAGPGGGVAEGGGGQCAGGAAGGA